MNNQTSGFLNVYQRYARFYNLYFGRLMNPGRVRAVSVANLKSGEKVLEVGVGTGLSLPLYPSQVEVTGIDLSPEMLGRAKAVVEEQGLDNVKELSVMNAEDMTFADDSFDCIMAMHVSTVIGDPIRFANEMRRVCRPHGRIIIVNYFYDPSKLTGQIAKNLAPYAKFIGFRPDLTLEEFLRRTKFKVDQSIPVNIFKIWNVLVIPNDKSMVLQPK